ncbi:hypothetical protein C7410_1483 [Paraburkholderia silvatlantica]|uniref:Uncharacterized protein n=1 Tax=Paraburkholderia silvatlantica TaxID=321895 RepID=A0A2V4TPW7_9BURK|nr:hypothetical protein C7410_1483 [Paraburkholderia silvatlantica]
MEYLIRIYTEKDRQVLEWLRQRVGDAAIAQAVEQCGGAAKPYLPAVCRRLGVRIPMLAKPRVIEPGAVAEQSLATIRGILASRSPGAGSRASARTMMASRDQEHVVRIPVPLEWRKRLVLLHRGSGRCERWHDDIDTVLIVNHREQ